MGLLSIDVGDDVIKTCAQLRVGSTTKLIGGENCLLLEKRDKKWFRISFETQEREPVVQSTVSCPPFLTIMMQSQSPSTPLVHGLPSQMPSDESPQSGLPAGSSSETTCSEVDSEIPSTSQQPVVTTAQLPSQSHGYVHGSSANLSPSQNHSVFALDVEAGGKPKSLAEMSQNVMAIAAQSLPPEEAQNEQLRGVQNKQNARDVSLNSKQGDVAASEASCAENIQSLDLQNAKTVESEKTQFSDNEDLRLEDTSKNKSETGQSDLGVSAELSTIEEKGVGSSAVASLDTEEAVESTVVPRSRRITRPRKVPRKGSQAKPTVRADVATVMPSAEGSGRLKRRQKLADVMPKPKQCDVETGVKCERDGSVTPVKTRAESLKQIADQFNVVIKERENLENEGESDETESRDVLTEYIISCTKCNELVSQFEMTKHIREEHASDAKSMILLYNKIKRRLREIKRTQCQYCSKSIKFVNVLKHEENCKMRLGARVKKELSIFMDAAETDEYSQNVSTSGIEPEVIEHEQTNEAPDDTDLKNAAGSDVMDTETNGASEETGADSERTRKRPKRNRAPEPDARLLEEELFQDIEKEFGVRVEKLSTEVSDGDGHCEETDPEQKFSLSCVACELQFPYGSVSMHFKRMHPNRDDVPLILSNYTKIRRKLREMRKEECPFCSKRIRYICLKRHQLFCKANPSDMCEKIRKQRKERIRMSGYESKEQIECEILQATEKEFGVKIEKLNIEIPGGDVCDESEGDQRFSISCVACGDQIPQNSVSMHFKENHFERSDLSKVMSDYAKIKRVLRELRQAKCDYCGKYMRYVNLKRHQIVCKVNSRNESEEISPDGKSPQDPDAARNEHDPGVVSRKKILHSDTLHDWLESLSDQFNVSVKLIGLDTEDENLIWQEHLQNFTLSCRLCQEDILCCEINSHLKEKHTEQNQENIDKLVTFYTKIKRRIRELKRTTCRFCGKNIRCVNLPSHLNSCKLNPANSMDIEDIAAEQFEIDAILENIYDTYQIRIVRANTLLPNTPRGKNSVINESFIITCGLCGAQFEHFDIEEHLTDFHAEEVHILLIKEKYRQALVMLVGENESECLFCNEKISIADLSSHMRECRIKGVTHGTVDDVLSTATDLDLLVQSLSRRFQVDISRCPEYGEENDDEKQEDKEPLFLVTCEICQEGVLHLAMRRHLRKVHSDCSQETFYKYSKITRRLQDLRKLKCVYCNKYFRVVSLRVHMRRCMKDQSAKTDSVVETLRKPRENDESFCDKFHEVTKENNFDPIALCEQIFAVHNVKLRHKEGTYSLECEFCSDLFNIESIRSHVQSDHGDEKGRDLAMEKYKRINRRIRETERRQKAPTVECKYCHRKLKAIFVSSYAQHLSKCALNPNRDQKSPRKTDTETPQHDAKIEDETGENSENADSSLFVCEICMCEFSTATTLIHHLTKDHKTHEEYQRLWDLANEARQNNLVKMVTFEACKKESVQRTWRCSGCGFKATSLADMKVHKSGCEQLKNRGYICHLCGREMKSHSSRWYHMKTRHGLALGSKKPQFYPCPICGKVCDVPSRLEKHLLSHSEKRNYICDWCAQPFKTSFGLSRHIERIHKNIYPYYCKKCGHGLKNKMWLERHRCERRRKHRVARIPKNKHSEETPQENNSESLNTSNQPNAVCQTVEVVTQPTVENSIVIPQQPNPTSEISKALASHILAAQLASQSEQTLRLETGATVHHMSLNAINVAPVDQEQVKISADQLQLRTSTTEQLQLRTEGGQLQIATSGSVQQNPVAVDVSAFFHPTYDYMELLRQTTGNNM